jgi:hypothetical protein
MRDQKPRRQHRVRADQSLGQKNSQVTAAKIGRRMPAL